MCAVSLVGQWVAEVQSKLSDDSVRIYQYHGQGRLRDVQRLASYDVIVTTYQVSSFICTLCTCHNNENEY